MLAVDFESLAGLVAVVTLPAAALAWMFVSSQAATVVAIVGWLFLVPVLGVLSEEEILVEAADDEAEREQDPLDELRDRYARGEIDEMEFERRLERLLETEDAELPPDARDRMSSEPEPTEPTATERERDF